MNDTYHRCKAQALAPKANRTATYALHTILISKYESTKFDMNRYSVHMNTNMCLIYLYIHISTQQQQPKRTNETAPDFVKTPIYHTIYHIRYALCTICHILYSIYYLYIYISITDFIFLYQGHTHTYIYIYTYVNTYSIDYIPYTL